ncbi:hypothetical protein FWC63_01715 [Candidatus Saccharibacteria bacterium]|nr:hypothetical protein [Candidatus Saccharibacteria bacterium]
MAGSEKNTKSEIVKGGSYRGAGGFLKIQDINKPLHPDSLLPPDRLDLCGKILIIGGSSAGFAGVSYTYGKTLELGAAEVKVLLPKCLEKMLPKNPDFIFSGDAKSLGFTKAIYGDLKELATWADGILLIGDFGKNSETQQTFAHFLGNLKDFHADKKPILVTRDAISLLNDHLPLENPHLKMLITFNQLQHLFKSVLYPKLINFSTPLPQVAEALHKFTLTYECGLATFTHDNHIATQDGKVIVTNLATTKYNPLTLWAGEAATRTLLLSLWSPNPKITGLAGGIL